MKDFTFSRLYAALIAVCFSLSASAQLTVDFDQTPDEMAQNLVGQGVEIFNVSVTAADSSFGYYTSAGTELGTSEGLLLTTGNAINAIGPNDETGLPIIDGTDCLNCDEYDNDFPGSELLTIANGGLNTWDACTFEFDVVPQGDSLKFDFTFASEEYLEWVGSSFNDVFGFFITGPNVGTDVNIALIPGTNDAVAINSVNNIDNSQFFFDNQNPLGQGIQYDGFTVGISAEVGDLIPCEIYRLKLIIADGSDRLYDSAVFVNQIESNPITITTSTVGGTEFMVEGCNDGTVQFESTFIPTEDLEVNFQLEGDAEFGVDFITDPDLDLFYDELTEIYTLIIPEGQTTVSFEILPIADGLTEGQEIVTISLVDQQCDGFEFQSSVDFAIIDELEVSLDPSEATICTGQCVTLTGDALTDGDATFEWDPAGDVSDPNTLEVEVCPTVTTTYTLTSTLANCEVSATSTVTVTTPQFNFDVTNITCDNGSTGAIDVTVTEVTPPLTYEWTLNDIFFSNSEDLTGLEEGTYCLTVTDSEGCTNTECVEVIEDEVLNIFNVEFSNFGCFPISCNGASDGSITVEVEGGTGALTYVWTDSSDNVFGGNSATVSDLSAGTYTVTVTDELGCEVSETYVLNEPDLLEIELAGTTDVLCTGEETGVATVTATGGCPPYFYSWSHDPDLTAPVATELPAGEFTVTVTDVNGCTSQQSVTITINEPGEPIDVTVDAISTFPGGFNVSCPDATDGSVDVTISGGIPPYVSTWINTQTGDTYFTEDLNGIPCGPYELTVVDSNDCEFFLEVDLTCVPDWNVAADITPNPCGDPTAGIGSIDLTVSGSHGGPYTFEWVGDGCPCATEDLSNLNSGDYTVIITDALGCTFEQTFNVGTNDQFTVTPTITSPECGAECSGSIELDILPVDVDLITWSGPDGYTSNDEDIFNLCAGVYEVTIIDGACEETFTYVVTEPDPIVIDFDDIVPPVCFGQNNGSLSATVTGGTGVITYEWAPNADCFFPGSSNSEITNLFECTYVLTVTDELGCTATDSIFLEAPQVMDIFVELSQFEGGFNISCPGASDGQISVSVEGGSPDCAGFDPECYNYDWTSCDPVNVPGSSFQDELPEGSYCVVVTDANGCIATTEIDMTDPPEIESAGEVSDYNGFGVSCAGACDGFITPEVTGGNGNYIIYDWIQGDIGDNDPEAETLTDLCPGIYELRIVDTNDCEDIITFEITEPDPLELTVDNVTPVSCFGYSDGAVSVTATGGVPTYTFDWNDGQYFGNVLTNIPADTLELTLTDLNGCQLTEEVIIEQPDTFIVELTVPTLEDSPFDLQCAGDEDGSILAEIIGGVPDFSIIWTGDAITDINALNQEGLPAGTYTITVTDADGCEAEETAEITAPEEQLTVTSEVSSYPSGFEISCFGACDGFIDLTVAGGVEPYTYLWELDNNGDEFAITEDVADLCGGLYEVLVSDANGCDTLMIFEIDQPEQLQANEILSEYAGGFNVSCAENCDGSVEIEPSGGIPDYTWEWTLNGEAAGSGSALTDLCGDDQLMVTITDAVDCSVEIPIVLNVPDTLAINEVVSQISCFGEDDGSISLNLSGGAAPYTYEWEDGVGSGDNLTDLGPGTYCVNVTDANGCTTDGCFEIIEPEELSAEAIPVNANCGVCDGSILLTIEGGTGDISITWDGPTSVPADTESAVNLCPGTYNIVVVDDNLCTLDFDIAIEGPPAIEIDGVASNPLCFGDCDGGVDVTITNGVAPLTTTWIDANGDTVSNEEDLNGICSGSFTLSVVDADGCTAEANYAIAEPDSITINGFSPLADGVYNVSEFEGSDGSIETDVQGGTPDYTLIWEGPSGIDDNTVDPDGLTAGSYTLTVTDANGCVKDTTIILTQPDDLTLPTGVSPNNDGANDTYVILGIDQYPDNLFKVFNRWGNLVYEKEDYNNEWDGRNDAGEDLADGTYFVVFEAGDRQFATYVDLRR